MSKIVIGKNIEKSFGTDKEQTKVLQDVSITIEEGEFISVMGPSGSGKSTLLMALSALEQIDNGKVMFDSLELSSLKERELSDIRRSKMGFVFQQPTMLKNLNLLDNIMLPAIRGNRKNLGTISQNAYKLMRSAGIEDLMNRFINQVSGGQLQRAGICRALINNPKIIYADEPTGALNSKSAVDIMKLFTDINQSGTAVLLVTHDAKVAACSERILFMSDGRVISELKLSKAKKDDMDKRIELVIQRLRELGI
jgi:putative ABC transport system ATP-binding protein